MRGGPSPAPELNGIAGDLSHEQAHWIPVTDAAGDQPAPAVVINRGKSPTESERGTLKSAPCTSETVRWFTGRDYITVVPIRRDYSATGGSMTEVNTDYAAGPRDYTRNRLRHRCRGPVCGVSGLCTAVGDGGGWVVRKWAVRRRLCRDQPAACVGHPQSQPQAWRPYRQHIQQQLPTRSVERCHRPFGRTAETPMLWICTENDSYFASKIAHTM